MYIKMTIKKSQIWVETAIYTLIGLTLIAIVLSVATPQIQKLKDRSIINQASQSFSGLNELILDVAHTPGNIRIFYFNFDKGRFEISPTDDSLLFTLENTNLKFSELDKEIKQGEIIYKTESYGKKYNVMLKLNYFSGGKIDIRYKVGGSTIDATVGNTVNDKKIFYGGIYKIKIENKGVISGKTVIDFELI